MGNTLWDPKRQAEITKQVDYLLNMTLDPDTIRKEIAPSLKKAKEETANGDEMSYRVYERLLDIEKVINNPNISTRDLLTIKLFLECWK